MAAEAAQLVAQVFVETEGLGQVYPAGTKATAELRKLIPNPAAWSEPEPSASKSDK